jgi:glycosyltransferase involved in cell wall biosynthesis
MNWITSQIGAREHYAVPRVLHRVGKLERLYTDFWASATWRLIGKLTGKGSLASRCHVDLIGAPVTGFNFHALKASRQRFTNPYDGFFQIGRQFGELVVKDLEKQSRVERRVSRAMLAESRDKGRGTRAQLPVTSSTVFFGYDTGFLEPARWIKTRGGKTIVCQMDPARYEVDLVKEEEKRWPGWAKRSVEVPEAYYRRREEEWAVADLVMVNSEWTKAALIRQGVSDDKIVVVPLAYEAGEVESKKWKVKGENERGSSRFNSSTSQPFNEQNPLRVLFLGQVILRKGIQYLMEAAMLLRNEAIHFDIVGSIGISDQAVSSAPSNMTFHGPVSRDRTEGFYRSADLFVLPTLSDGFALTQLEAMAHGLPVIATPNCGEVVTDGVDGLIVLASDSNALAEAFQLLIQDPEKLRSMSAATGAKVEQFSLGRLGENLEEVERRLKAET